MNRLSHNGAVHFSGANGYTLCGIPAFTSDLLGQAVPVMSQTADRVTCADCAKLYCQVKNAPWNEVDSNVLMNATYEAVK